MAYLCLLCSNLLWSCEVQKIRKRLNLTCFFFFLLNCSLSVVVCPRRDIQIGRASNYGKLCKTFLYCLRKFINAACVYPDPVLFLFEEGGKVPRALWPLLVCLVSTSLSICAVDKYCCLSSALFCFLFYFSLSLSLSLSHSLSPQHKHILRYCKSPWSVNLVPICHSIL